MSYIRLYNWYNLLNHNFFHLNQKAQWFEEKKNHSSESLFFADEFFLKNVRYNNNRQPIDCRVKTAKTPLKFQNLKATLQGYYPHWPFLARFILRYKWNAQPVHSPILPWT
jgi:hypothetical protein